MLPFSNKVKEATYFISFKMCCVVPGADTSHTIQGFISTAILPTQHPGATENKPFQHHAGDYFLKKVF